MDFVTLEGKKRLILHTKWAHLTCRRTQMLGDHCVKQNFFCNHRTLFTPFGSHLFGMMLANCSSPVGARTGSRREFGEFSGVQMTKGGCLQVDRES